MEVPQGMYYQLLAFKFIATNLVLRCVSLCLKDIICSIKPLRDSIWKEIVENMACKTFVSCGYNSGTPGCSGSSKGTLHMIFNTELL